MPVYYRCDICGVFITKEQYAQTKHSPGDPLCKACELDRIGEIAWTESLEDMLEE